MFEETNQTMEGFDMDDLPENLFEDEAEDTSTAADAESEEESLHRHTAVPLPLDKGGLGDGSETGKAQNREGENHAGGILPPSATVPPPRGLEGDESGRVSDGNALRIKYNGEERDLSLDEARTLAQKGMNYDHVVQERDRNRNAFDFLMERAKSEGITVEQFIERERKTAENQRLEAKISEIRARDDDASEETVKNLATLELEAERARAERERAQALEEQNKAEIEGWNRLFREHPELIAANGGAKISQGVFDLVKSGYSPVEAYYIERNRELEERSRMISDASAAKEKSVGSLAGVQSAEEDDFLAGFEGE